MYAALDTGPGSDGATKSIDGRGRGTIVGAVINGSTGGGAGAACANADGAAGGGEGGVNAGTYVTGVGSIRGGAGGSAG